jgi:hypothetical protein
VNWQHLRAFVWLRWRLLVHQLTRGGLANAVLLVIAAVAAGFLVVGLFAGSLLVGLVPLARVSPAFVMYVWDGLVVGFLFCWMIGLITVLQRSEVLSLDKFLHLPVSLAGVFLLNYLSSLVSLTLLVFVPIMLGLTLGLIISRGPALLLQLPLLLAFLLMVTALTYQFQGWLASLMVNQRRRRTVIVTVTAAFILLAQAPQLINILRPWDKHKHDERAAQLSQAQEQLLRSLADGQITRTEYEQRQQQLVRTFHAQTQESNRQALQQVAEITRLINLVLPPGWLPLGAMASAEGIVLPALLSTLGMALIGMASLWRSYRTTVRLYTGAFSSGKKRSAPVAAPAPADKATVHLLERKLPWVSEQAAAIALASLRTLLRAPEAKLLLLSPILLIVIFGGMILSHSWNVPEAFRPLIVAGGMAMTLLCLVQLVGNQFGFDRSGFRVFVLCAAPRQDILLGKNLAVAPLALGLGVIVALLVEVLAPMRFDYFLALLPQLVSMYLLFCLLANLLSIWAPMPIAAGSLKPVQPKVLPVIMQIVFVFLFPLALAPTLLPLVVQFVFEQFGWTKGVPICLILSVLECAAVVYFYRLILIWQGNLLQSREKKILQTVAAKAE